MTTASVTVACHEHGTRLKGFLPRGWDRLVASDGTTWRVAWLVLIRLLGEMRRRAVGERPAPVVGGGECGPEIRDQVTVRSLVGCSVIWSLVSLDRVAVPSADWIVHGFRKLEARPAASAFLAVARLRKPVRPVTGMMPYRESAAADGA
jgi:hypothetical protein